MLTNGKITLYHVNDDDTYEISKHSVSISRKTKAVPDESGVRYDNLAYIRIPTTGEVVVTVGDHVFIGDTDDVKPDLNNCMTVLGFADNRRGSLAVWHWRLDCK